MAIAATSLIRLVGQPAGNFPKGWTVVTALGGTNCISLEPSEYGRLAAIRIRQVAALCRQHSIEIVWKLFGTHRKWPK